MSNVQTGLLASALQIVACTAVIDDPAVRTDDEQTSQAALNAVSATVIDIRPANSPYSAPIEAPAAFDGATNGFVDALAMEAVTDIFREEEEVEDGLGPIYNARGCGNCHDNPVVGGNSQVTALRAGHFDGTNFIDHPGGSPIGDRAIDASIQEHVLPGNEVRAFRLANSLLGAGFVEAIDSEDLLAVARSQPSTMRGEPTMVPVNEAGNVLRVGRFGWKAHQASLISFSAAAYLNEMGITSPLQPRESTSMGNSVAAFDTVSDPEDNGEDVEAFATFMRSLKAPPVDPILSASASAQRGSVVFDQVGCATCHVRTFVTAPAGTQINGGAFIVPEALANKTIHPFSDFLLHDIGTGDGIVQNAGQSTRNKMRTAPLWGLRTRNRLMHDGQSTTIRAAIVRHCGQAQGVIDDFAALNWRDRDDLLNFLGSL